MPWTFVHGVFCLRMNRFVECVVQGAGFFGFAGGRTLCVAGSGYNEVFRRREECEGYEIKRGNFISCRASDQERFTRMKTLGIDYTEEAVTAWIAGGSRPSRQPKQRDGRISLLIDIQNNLKVQQSAGFTHWAKLNNLKQAALNRRSL